MKFDLKNGYMDSNRVQGRQGRFVCENTWGVERRPYVFKGLKHCQKFARLEYGDQANQSG